MKATVSQMKWRVRTPCDTSELLGHSQRFQAEFSTMSDVGFQQCRT